MKAKEMYRKKAREIYQQIAMRDDSLLRTQTQKALESTAQEALESTAQESLKLAEDCAENYGVVRQAGLFKEADNLRRWSLYWSIQHKQATGILKFFELRTA